MAQVIGYFLGLIWEGKLSHPNDELVANFAEPSLPLLPDPLRPSGSVSCRVGTRQSRVGNQ